MVASDIWITVASALIESRVFNYAFGVLLIYDHIVCFGEEVEYFWTGPWSLSRFLYLSIRYTALALALFTITAAGLTYKSPFFASVLLVKIFVFILPITVLCQLVITLRVWYLYSRNLAVKIIVVTLMLSTSIMSTLISASNWKEIRADSLNPFAPTSRALAWIYVPSLVIHSVLFGLKVYRFLTSSARNQSDSLLWGFMKEGMIMYACSTASLSFGVLGLTMVEPSQLIVRMPAASGIPVVTFIILSVCRSLINIRSVAATAHVDPDWLLNHAELSRVRWRRGSVDGELIVETGGPVTPRSTQYFRMK